MSISQGYNLYLQPIPEEDTNLSLDSIDPWELLDEPLPINVFVEPPPASSSLNPDWFDHFKGYIDVFSELTSLVYS